MQGREEGFSIYRLSIASLKYVLLIKLHFYGTILKKKNQMFVDIFIQHAKS